MSSPTVRLCVSVPGRIGPSEVTRRDLIDMDASHEWLYCMYNRTSYYCPLVRYQLILFSLNSRTHFFSIFFFSFDSHLKVPMYSILEKKKSQFCKQHINHYYFEINIRAIDIKSGMHVINLKYLTPLFKNMINEFSTFSSSCC